MQLDEFVKIDLADEIVSSKAEKELEDIEFGARKFEGVPKHVAVICDGNRRWERAQGLPEGAGHEEGAENGLRLLHRASELGVETLTVWLGDTKNIKKRSKQEVKKLVKLIFGYMLLLKQKHLDKSVRIRHMGLRDMLPPRLRDLINEVEGETKDHEGITFNLAFNYGGRDELIDVFQRMSKDGIKAEDVTEELIESYLQNNDLGEPDMIIRTGGEFRLSGFMPWQSVGSELFFSDAMFPAFTPDLFEEMVMEFPKRERRLGK